LVGDAASSCADAVERTANAPAQDSSKAAVKMLDFTFVIFRYGWPEVKGVGTRAALLRGDCQLCSQTPVLHGFLGSSNVAPCASDTVIAVAEPGECHFQGARCR
jgi:hypothetical protein